MKDVPSKNGHDGMANSPNMVVEVAAGAGHVKGRNVAKVGRVTGKLQAVLGGAQLLQVVVLANVLRRPLLLALASHLGDLEDVLSKSIREKRRFSKECVPSTKMSPSP